MMLRDGKRLGEVTPLGEESKEPQPGPRRATYAVLPEPQMNTGRTRWCAWQSLQRIV